MINFKEKIIENAKNNLNEKKYIVFNKKSIFDYDNYSDPLTIDEALKFVNSVDSGLYIIFQKQDYDELQRHSSTLHKIVGDDNG